MMKAKGFVTVPANVQAQGPLKVTRANGTVTISFDPSSLGPTPGSANVKVIAWNSVTGEFSLTDLSSLINS